MNILEKFVQQLNLKKQFLMLCFLEAVGFVVVYFDNS